MSTPPAGQSYRDKWASKAFSKHKGALHRQLHVPEGKKIPLKKLHAAERKGGLIAKRAHLAETARHFKH